MESFFIHKEKLQLDAKPLFHRALISAQEPMITPEPGFPLVTKPIVIKDYAWIAADAFVHPGVKIEEGCVIGARSVVTSDMPAWTICAGFPCKPIRERLSAGEIENFKNH